MQRLPARTRDPELAQALLSDNYAAHRPRIGGSPERFRFSLSSATVGSIASDTLVHSLSTRVAVEPMRSLTAGYVARGWVVVRSGRDEQLLCPGDVGLYPYGARLEVRWDRIDQTVLRLSFDKR